MSELREGARVVFAKRTTRNMRHPSRRGKAADLSHERVPSNAPPCAPGQSLVQQSAWRARFRFTLQRARPDKVARRLHRRARVELAALRFVGKMCNGRCRLGARAHRERACDCARMTGRGGMTRRVRSVARSRVRVVRGRIDALSFSPSLPKDALYVCALYVLLAWLRPFPGVCPML